MAHVPYKILSHLSKQSLICSKVFILLVLLIISSIYPQQPQDSSGVTSIVPLQSAKPEAEPKTDYPSIKFAAHLSGTYRIPVRDGGVWDDFITAGVNLDFPTKISSRLCTRFSIEAGELAMSEDVLIKNPTVPLLVKNIKIVYLTLSMSYDFPFLDNAFIVRPRLGLSNAMISIMDFGIEGITHFFRTFENEFGLVCGVEPLYHKGKWINISVPMYANIMFSSPDVFITGCISLTAGVVF